MGWRGVLPEAGMEGNVPGVVDVEGRSSKAGVEGNVPGVVDVEGGSSKSWDGGEIFQLSPLSSLIPCKLILK